MQILRGKPVERRPLGIPSRIWEDNIKMELRDVGWEHGLDHSGSGQGQVASSCECGSELPGFINCGEFRD
jgi:hypothetical protein